MPSPFPGMDPYLEDPILWPGVQHHLVTYLASFLNRLLPTQYVAKVGERVYVEEPGRSIYPDIMVTERPSRPVRELESSSGGLAVIDAPTIISVPISERTEPFIEIRTVGREGRLVTVVEVLSHANKAPGSNSRSLYLRKQAEALQSQSHLIEIDLLRAGQHTLAPERDQMMHIAPWDYMVSLHRGCSEWRYEVWPILLRERLPCIAIPLTDNDPDVALDLQQVLDRCYDEGAYDRQVDYHQRPDPPLSPEDTAWVEGRGSGNPEPPSSHPHFQPIIGD